MAMPERIENASSDRNKVGSLLQDIGHLQRQYMRMQFKSLPLTTAEGRAIMYLSANEGVSQVTLARLLDIRPITLTRILEKLEKGGYIERRSDPEDQRAYQLFLTRTGRQTIKRIAAVVDEFGRRIVQALSPGELEQVVNGLERLRGALAAVHMGRPSPDRNS